MVKKLRFQEIRNRRRRTEPRPAWVFEPLDGALLGAGLIIALLLQWVSQA